MWEIYLIIALGALSALLLFLVIKRQREMRGAIHIGEEMINDLLAAVVQNAKAGRISAIADKITGILKSHMKCDKIVFLVNNRGILELKHFDGLNNPDYAIYRFPLDKEIYRELRDYGQVTPIATFEQIITPEKFADLSEEGYNYFFAVNIGSRLAGVYLIASTLSQQNPSLRLLTSALAYSLSAADHIRQQDKRLRKAESRLQSLYPYEKIDDENRAAVRPELVRLLKIKNSKKLIGELVKQVGKEANLTRVALYTGDDRDENAIFSVNWHLKSDTDKALKEFHRKAMGEFDLHQILDIEKLSISLDGDLTESLRKLKDSKIRYIAPVPWIDNRRALLAWDSEETPEQFRRGLLEFWNNALPLVEHLNRFEKVQEMSYTDGLTGLYNFRYFQKRMMEEFHRAERYGHSLALLIFDMDNLKEVNDSMGHPTGDLLLKSFSEVLVESVRSVDVICRYGGDEFCIILPETSRSRALLLMDRIQRNIAKKPVQPRQGGPELKYSVSVGGAVYPSDAETVESLIKAADTALLRAKEDGRNCSRLFEPGKVGHYIKPE